MELRLNKMLLFVKCLNVVALFFSIRSFDNMKVKCKRMIISTNIYFLFGLSLIKQYNKIAKILFLFLGLNYLVANI